MHIGAEPGLRGRVQLAPTQPETGATEDRFNVFVECELW